MEIVIGFDLYLPSHLRFPSWPSFSARNKEKKQRERKHIEYQIKTDDKIDKIFKLIEDKDIKPEKGIFYDGQILRTLIIL